MKKVISIVLCALLVFGIPAAAIPAQNCSCSNEPVIIVQGYSGPQLFLDYGLSTEQHVWGVDNNGLMDLVLQKLPHLLAGLGSTAFGNDDLLVESLGGVLNTLLEPVRCNDDGSSKYNISVYPNGAEATNAQTLIDTNEERYTAEAPIAQDFIDTVGASHVYTFTWDWRKGQVESARALDEYIQQVKEHSGHSKVRFYALSHGGQLAATYFYYYAEKNDVSRAVLNVPAIGGTSLVYDLFKGDFAFSVAALIEFAEIGSRTELELEWLVESFGFENTNAALNRLIHEYLLDLVLTWGSIWDLVSAEHYDELKNEFLDPVKHEKVIAAADEMHYNVMPNIGSALRSARNAGTEIFIMTNTGRALATGSAVNSDYILDAANTSGAICAPLGERFEKGYVPAGTACKNKSHNHISPGQNIDATAAYLPEHTWFINGQYHGQSNWDSYSRSLYMELLFGEEIKDIYSYPNYPQFELAQNPADGIYAKFNKTISGYANGSDSAMIVKNLSETSDITLKKILLKGEEADVEIEGSPTVSPGESVEIELVKELPFTEGDYFEITLTYCYKGTVPYEKSKSFDFTFLNSQAETEQPEITNPPDREEVNETEIYSEEETDASKEKAKEAETETETETENPDTGGKELLWLICVLPVSVAGLAVSRMKKKEKFC